jgi:hypothetical protein
MSGTAYADGQQEYRLQQHQYAEPENHGRQPDGQGRHLQGGRPEQQQHRGRYHGRIRLLGGTAVRVTGNITATGNIDISSGSVLNGALSGGSISANSNVSISGNVRRHGRREHRFQFDHFRPHRRRHRHHQFQRDDHG